jgi:hypothetical protein
VPSPADTVQNPLYGMRISYDILSQIKGYAKMKIALWAIVTGIAYYFGNWMWAIIPGMFTLSKISMRNRQSFLIDNQIRSIVFLDVKHI